MTTEQTMCGICGVTAVIYDGIDTRIHEPFCPFAEDEDEEEE